MSKIKKIIDERETQKQNKTKKHQQKNKEKQNREDGSYCKRVWDKWFCWAFKLGFLQLRCKDSLIFKSNLELALSIILNERELYESKHVGVEFRVYKFHQYS